jgi:hypothetical protein
MVGTIGRAVIFWKQPCLPAEESRSDEQSLWASGALIVPLTAQHCRLRCFHTKIVRRFQCALRDAQDWDLKQRFKAPVGFQQVSERISTQHGEERKEGFVKRFTQHTRGLQAATSLPVALDESQVILALPYQCPDVDR